MLSLGKISAGQGGYYLEAVAQGREDYYTNSGEVPGRWLGRGADALGLSGPVADEAFVAVLAGVDPSGGVALGRANRRVSAFDLTLSAPKSVSLLWALGPPGSATAVVAAHEAAVDAALGWLERTAVRSRVGHNGVGQIEGEGLVAAAFRHRTSRAGDPQVHTHVVVANATRGADGVWRTLDARWIYTHARTAGFLYQAELRQQLSTRLGVSWADVDRGVAEIEGVERRAVRAFSRRRLQIEDALAGGETSASQARTAALATRPTKLAVPFEVLATDWQERAADLNVDLNNVVHRAVLRPQQPRSTVVEASTPPVDAVELGDGLCEQQAVFARRDVLRLLAQRARHGASVADLEAVADRYLEGGSVVVLAEDHFGARYTTTDQIELERRMVARAVAGVGCGAGWCPPVVDDRAVAGLAGLTDEQRTMVQTITGDGNAVSVVVGVAGSGKTHAMRHAVDRWREWGYQPVGCALAARAAQGLGREAGMPSTTIDRLLVEIDRGEWSPHARTVLIADEAGMVGTRKLARLVESCGQAGAKLVLVGDHRQLPEIEAGGAFAELARALPAVSLTDNRRQHDPGERALLADLRDGNVGRAVGGLEQLRRVQRFSNPHEARERLVADWLEASRSGGLVIMTAMYLQDVEDLNRLARRRLTDDGQLAGPELHVDDVSFAVGDRVVALRNRHDLDLLNGDTAIVRQVDERGLELLVTLDRGGERRIPTSYLAAGDLAHGYAITVHKSQGMTVDEAFVYTDAAVYREAGYTALSRARQATHVYHVDDEPDIALAELLGRSRQKTIAVSLLESGHSSERIRQPGLGMEL